MLAVESGILHAPIRKITHLPARAALHHRALRCPSPGDWNSSCQSDVRAMNQNVITSTKKTKIVIAGRGFVGLTAARYFDQGSLGEAT